jgi:O-antigen/teichoic acid export membrane protein
MESTGLFSASARIALFVTFVMTAINVIGMPMMASALHDGDSEGLADIYRRARLWSLLGALPVFVVLVTFPERVLSLFGDEFSQAASLLRVLALGQLFNAAVGLAGSLLVVGGEERYFMNSMLSVTLLCVMSMLLAIPLWGAMGAVCCYSTSLGVLSLLQLYRAEHIIRPSSAERKSGVYE